MESTSSEHDAGHDDGWGREEAEGRAEDWPADSPQESPQKPPQGSPNASPQAPKEEEEEYDYVVFGTGLTECILSGLLSMHGHRVLHVDRNDHYGGDCASLNLTQLFERFRSNEPPPSGKYGRERDYNVDIVPKFMLASGELIDILVHTDVQRYLQFQQIGGSFVWLRSKGLSKVPSSEMEALSSSLLGIVQKAKVTALLHYIKAADPDDPSTWGSRDYNLAALTTRAVFKDYGLDDNSQDMVGHALALHPDDSYLQRPAADTFRRVRLYMNSLARFGRSPYVYPLYGLGELPQAFARLSAIYGGTYMLGTPLQGVRVDPARPDRVTDVCLQMAGSSADAKKRDQWVRVRRGIIAHPSYFPERVRQAFRVVRAICLLTEPVPSTHGADSCQIILPQRQLNRHSDVYVTCLSSQHCVCPVGYYVAIASTVVETEDPHRELQPALDLLGPIVERFVWISKAYEPLPLESAGEDGGSPSASGNVHVTTSYDPSSHFESVVEDVKRVYQQATGQPLALSAAQRRPTCEEEQAELERRMQQTTLV